MYKFSHTYIQTPSIWLSEYSFADCVGLLTLHVSLPAWPLTVTRYYLLKGMANGRPASQHNTKLKHNALHTSTAPGASRHKIRYNVMTVSFLNIGYSLSPGHWHLPRTRRRNKITCPLVDVQTYQGRVHCLSKCGGVRLKHCVWPHGWDLGPIHTMRQVSVPSECSVFTLSIVFSHLPIQHVIGGLRLFPSICSPIRFLKTISSNTIAVRCRREKCCSEW